MRFRRQSPGTPKITNWSGSSLRSLRGCMRNLGFCGQSPRTPKTTYFLGSSVRSLRDCLRRLGFHRQSPGSPKTTFFLGSSVRSLRDCIRRLDFFRQSPGTPKTTDLGGSSVTMPGRIARNAPSKMRATKFVVLCGFSRMFYRGATWNSQRGLDNRAMQIQHPAQA